MKVFTIWREATGGFVLTAGDVPVHPGDVCHKRLDVETWTEALKELHKFMDQRAKGGMTT